MENRNLRSDEREALLELLDGWSLPDGWRGRDFFRRYIEDDPTYRDENVWVAADESGLHSCVQIFPRRVRVLGHAVPTGGIGSVFTRESHRGRGLAAGLLADACSAMAQEGLDLSLLFAGKLAFYAKLGWRSFPIQRAVVSGVDPDTPPEPCGADLEPFDWDRDFEAVRAIHSAYSASRNGTVVRDDTLWAATLGLAGNPSEEFRVARRDGRTIAYLRATLLNSVFSVTEFGRLEDAAEALAGLVEQQLRAREDDPLASPDHSSRELRAFVMLPAFDDLGLTVALEQRGVKTSPLSDPTPMLRCLDAESLANRLDVSLLPEESADELLVRLLPTDSLVFWPSDRF